MVATAYNKVLSPPDAQPAPFRPLEWWTDRNGQKWQRTSLGDVATGHLTSGPRRALGSSSLWRGRHSPRSIISDTLEATLRDAWVRMIRKSGRYQMHCVSGRSDDIALCWLAWLPLVPLPAVPDLLLYVIEPRLYGGGSDIFRIMPPPIRRPRG